MAVTVERSKLAEAVGWVASFVPSHPVVPILAGVRITHRNKHLSVQAYDYEVAAAVLLETESDDNWQCVVPGSLFAQIVKGAVGSSVSLEWNGDVLSWTIGRVSGNLHTLENAQYPNLPDRSDAHPFLTVDRAVLSFKVGIASQFCGDSDWQTGILLESGKNGAYVKAGSRVAMLRTQLPAGVGAVGSVLLPARSLITALKVPGTQTDILLSAEGTRVWLETSGDDATFVLTTPTIALEFPSTDPLFSAPRDISLHPESLGDLTEAVKSIGLVSNVISVEYAADLYLSAGAPYGGGELQSEAQVTVELREPIAYSGKSSIQSAYLSAALKGLRDEVLLDCASTGHRTWKVYDDTTETVIMPLNR